MVGGAKHLWHPTGYPWSESDHGYWYAFDDLLDHMAVVWQAHLEEIDRVVGEQGWRERGI